MTLMTADVSLPELDVVIPVAPKDAQGVRFCLDSVLRHCRNPIRAVHIVSRFPVRVPDERVRWLDESMVVPGIGDIETALRTAGSPHSNASWYFQQLLKLRCFDLLGADAPDHVLVVDADIAFVADVSFVEHEGGVWLPMGYPLRWTIGRLTAAPRQHSALSAAARLVPGWHPVDRFSGMQHHMVFDRKVLAELMRRVEDAHGMPFWRAFLTTIESSKWTGASEYVLYRHFACWLFPERVAMRHVSAAEVIQAAAPGGFALADVLGAPRTVDVQLVGCHRFLDYADRIATMDYISEDLRRELRPGMPLKLCLVQGELSIAHALDPLTLP
ncbi:DUF6492 family protein [Actinomadura alba]|uniref:Glycosyl transferase family 8 n=1 Tax=Actinomadura alba TaxID=406431 RepID=A0ABR7LKR3_9ACTN|nr:DUF6492 family protein [Actinomadura alba]MBC6465072.1 hypothetical protein [Actinomadura alba]